MFEKGIRKDFTKWSDTRHLQGMWHSPSLNRDWKKWQSVHLNRLTWFPSQITYLILDECILYGNIVWERFLESIAWLALFWKTPSSISLTRRGVLRNYMCPKDKLVIKWTTKSSMARPACYPWHRIWRLGFVPRDGYGEPIADGTRFLAHGSFSFPWRCDMFDRIFASLDWLLPTTTTT